MLCIDGALVRDYIMQYVSHLLPGCVSTRQHLIKKRGPIHQNNKQAPCGHASSPIPHTHNPKPARPPPLASHLKYPVANIPGQQQTYTLTLRARLVFMKLPACLSLPHQPGRMIFFECCNYHVTPCCHYSDCRRP